MLLFKISQIKRQSVRKEPNVELANTSGLRNLRSIQIFGIGRSKFLGEVDYPHAITLRTSIIGHELGDAHSLIEWFLAQESRVKGFRRAIFSGLPTVEVARTIRDYVIPHPQIHGIYHVSAEPINKFDLLMLVAQTYGKTIEISADDQLVIDRSLDSKRFRLATSFAPRPWPELIASMRDFG